MGATPGSQTPATAENAEEFGLTVHNTLNIESRTIGVMPFEISPDAKGSGSIDVFLIAAKIPDLRGPSSPTSWAGTAKVPSSRQVASAYGVSVVTASRAIQVLKDKGLIRTVERSGSFLTPAAPAAEVRECYALVQRSTPGPWFQASLAFSHAGFAAVARQEGVRFEVDRFRFDEATRPTDFLRQARRAAEAGYPPSCSCRRDTRPRPPRRTRRSSGRAARPGWPSF